MKKGERAVFTIAPEYAYGSTGAPPKIPANATLEFEVQLLSWKSVNALTPDGKVTLKMTKKDEASWQTPKDGWEVVVNMKGTVVGREKPFLDAKEMTFVVGKEDSMLVPTENLISNAIKKFKKGDQGTITIAPEHAFGEQGIKEHGIPPSATVKYDIQLLRWHEVDHIKDTPVIKKILEEGSGWEKPKEGAIIEIRATGRCVQSNKEILEISSANTADDPSELVLGSGKLPEALELAIPQMKKGEKALITAPGDYGYGTALTSQLNVPTAEDLEFEVELVSFEKSKDSWDMNREEKIAEMQKCREIGNQLFKDKKPRLAIKQYERAVKFYEYETDLKGEEKAKVDATNLPCHLNLAASYLKIRNHSKAIDHASKALKLDSTNVKALYRRAQAYLAIQEYEKAANDCDKALEVADEGGKRDVKILLRMVKERMKVLEEKERQLFSKMFSAVGK